MDLKEKLTRNQASAEVRAKICQNQTLSTERARPATKYRCSGKEEELNDQNDSTCSSSVFANKSSISCLWLSLSQQSWKTAQGVTLMKGQVSSISRRTFPQELARQFCRMATHRQGYVLLNDSTDCDGTKMANIPSSGSLAMTDNSNLLLSAPDALLISWECRTLSCRTKIFAIPPQQHV